MSAVFVVAAGAGLADGWDTYRPCRRYTAAKLSRYGCQTVGSSNAAGCDVAQRCGDRAVNVSRR